MKKILSKRKNQIIIIISIVIIISLILAIFFYTKPKSTKEVIKEDSIELKLNDSEVIILKLGEEFIDPGITVFVNDIISDRTYLTEGKVDTNIIGSYEITYSINNITIKRIINVIDDIPPTITLKGKDKITLVVDDNYIEYGYTANDNYDGDITDKVIIEGTVNAKKTGTYKLTYRVNDSSNNETEITRTITVNNKLIPKVEVPEVKLESPKTNYENEVTSMVWNNDGITVKANYALDITSFYLKNISSEEIYNYDITKNNNDYTFNINLASLQNGTYDLYLDNNQKIINKLEFIYQIKRSKIGNKLVTIDYDNNNVRIKLENFAYQYDILIDPGHGGSDPGAVNAYAYEKNLNLEISLYEKRRYEEHGLTVLMTRTTDTPNLGMGPSDWPEVRNRAYAMGYYGVVSKIVYSNHHNAHPNNSRMGYEIIVPAALSSLRLQEELNIYNAWQNIYPVNETHVRFYTRDYDSEAIYNKLSGTIYNFDTYYAVIRIPYNLFNVKSILYEGCHMSNINDYKWYYDEENWIKISEAKIKVYVEYLGKIYIPLD